MIKAWPEHVRRVVYECLCELWQDRSAPQHWKWRFLVPIPKKESPSLNDLRPLMLVEALRKIWTSIFVRRIQGFWGDNPGITEGQHGFLKGRGTDTSVVQMIQALETGKEFKTQVYISSWDMKRAFDALPKPLLVFSWIRMGVRQTLRNTWLLWIGVATH